MIRDIETVRKYCELNDKEEAVLSSPEKPIVLLKKKRGCPVAESVTMLNNQLGVMLPYTPLHCILMQNHEALVMTSGNLSDHPMIFDDAEALAKLPAVADCILTHNRQIYRRMDDSVLIVIDSRVHLIRRARGYVPEPAHLAGNKSVILAMGAQQKNTFCLCKGENAFLSGHIGDLDEADTADCLEREIAAFIRIFDASPQVIACDMHPDYVSSRLASYYEGKLPVLKIQHHHAHMASVLAEHNLNGNAIGITFDGTGLGTDGFIWGGEVLYGSCASFTRCGHLLYFPCSAAKVRSGSPGEPRSQLRTVHAEEIPRFPCSRVFGGAAILLAAATEA
jgi:hydrogenase maturation protein HypF